MTRFAGHRSIFDWKERGVRGASTAPHHGLDSRFEPRIDGLGPAPFCRRAAQLRDVYDDVLLPVALGNAADDPAVDRALDLADRYDATLHVLSVVDPAVMEPLAAQAGGVREAMTTEAESTVETVADRAHERGIDAETRVGQGSAATTITDYAERVDAVVMATHGRSGLGHALLGSVTERVVRTSPAPVLTVPQ